MKISNLVYNRRLVTKMMKKAILEEHDTKKLSLIQGPDSIINNLIQLQFDYDRFLDDNYFGMDGNIYNAEGFVKYINAVVLAEEYQKIKILELDLTSDEKSLPKIKLW